MMAAATATSRVSYLHVQRSDPKEISELWSNAVTWPARSPLATTAKVGPDVTLRLRAVWDMQPPASNMSSPAEAQHMTSPRHSRSLSFPSLEAAVAPCRNGVSPSTSVENLSERNNPHHEEELMAVRETTTKLEIEADGQKMSAPPNTKRTKGGPGIKFENLTLDPNKTMQNEMIAQATGGDIRDQVVSDGRFVSDTSSSPAMASRAIVNVEAVHSEQEVDHGITARCSSWPTKAWCPKLSANDVQGLGKGAGGSENRSVQSQNESHRTSSETSVDAQTAHGCIEESSDGGEESRHLKEGASKLPSSQYRGVVPQPNGRWGAQIYEKHQRVWLGTFNREEDAAQAYDRAAMKFRGRDAMTNFRPVQESDPEAVFLRDYSKEQIVEMLRRHTYEEELEQCKRLARIRSVSEQTLAGIVSTLPVHDIDRAPILQRPMPTLQREHLFEKAVTPSDVGKLNRLVIPKQHAERCFPLDLAMNAPCQTLSFEDVTGKHWRFRYSYWNSSQSYVFTKGWSRFVKEKKLDAGDAVSFERGSNHELYIDFRRRINNEVSHMLPGPSDMRSNLRGPWVPRLPTLPVQFGITGRPISCVGAAWHPHLNLANLTSSSADGFEALYARYTLPQHLQLSNFENLQQLQKQTHKESVSFPPAGPCRPLLGSAKGRREDDFVPLLELGSCREGAAHNRTAVPGVTANPNDRTETTGSGTRLFGVDLEKKSAQLKLSSSSCLNKWRSQISAQPYSQQLQSFTSRYPAAADASHRTDITRQHFAASSTTGVRQGSLPGSLQCMHVYAQDEPASFTGLTTGRSDEHIPLSPPLRLATAGCSTSGCTSLGWVARRELDKSQRREPWTMCPSIAGDVGGSEDSRKRKVGILYSMIKSEAAEEHRRDSTPDTSLSLAQHSEFTRAAQLSFATYTTHSLGNAQATKNSFRVKDMDQRSPKKHCSPVLGTDAMLDRDISTGPYIKCYMQWSPEQCLSTDLSKFSSTEGLRRELLEYTQQEFTQGLDILYKDKDGGVMLLAEESWKSFKSKVVEMLIRR